jgi:hypothetical protein
MKIVKCQNSGLHFLECLAGLTGDGSFVSFERKLEPFPLFLPFLLYSFCWIFPLFY